MITNATMAVHYQSIFTANSSAEIQGLEIPTALSDTLFDRARETEPDVDDNIGQ